MDDGILFLCELKDMSEDGDMPRESLVKIARHWYMERSIGINRQYLAKGVNEQVDILARIHHERRARIGMYALLGNGEQFRITNVSHIEEDVTHLRYTDLSLERLEDYFNVTDET